MRKSILFGILNIIILESCFSQEKADIKVYYTLKHQIDTIKKDSVYLENMLLLIGKNSSVFTSYDKLKQAEAIQKDIIEQNKNWTGPGLPQFKNLSTARNITTTEIFQFQKENKLVTKEFLIRNYLYEQPLDVIDWKLTTETKSFEKITCQKAIAIFKGREWVAWFAPEIPFETGPWKLHGLPGLILEAYDTKKEAQYLFAGLETVKPAIIATEANGSYDKTTTIDVPKKVIKIASDEILKLKQAMYKNPRSFFMAQIQATGGFVDNEAEMQGFSFKSINNPLDLTEIR
jgi:GLPGLI family protein